MSSTSPFPTVQLADVVDILDNLRIPVNSAERIGRAGTVPYYGANGFQGWIDRPLFNEPLILLAEDGGNFDDFASRPIAYRIDGPAWVNNHAHIIRAKACVNQSFIFWSIVNKDIRKYIAGGTRTKLTQGELRRIEINLPIEEEQKGIAHVLDTLDTTIQQTEAIIAKLKAVKQGLLHDLLTRGIDENGELRPTQAEAPHLYKASALGWIPQGWHTPVFGGCLEHVIDFRGRTPKKLGMEWGGGNILALSANNVQPGGIDISREAYFGGEVLYRKWMTSGDVRKGDVLLTMEAPLGNVAQVPDNARYILSQRVIALRFAPKVVLNDFAFWQMQSNDFQEAMVQRSTGSTATGIQRAELVRLLFKAPSPAEQDLICKVMASIEQKLASEIVALGKQKQKKSALMDDLLTGRVRVTPLLAAEPEMST
jgi:type I restriction enzyme S subunit